MLSETKQTILRYKLLGKLSVHCPEAPSLRTQAALDKAMDHVREMDDSTFDTAVDIAVRVAIKDLRDEA